MNKEIISILNKDKNEILNHHDLLFIHEKRIKTNTVSLKRIENRIFYLIIFIILLSILIMVFSYFWRNKQEPYPLSTSQNH